MQRHAHEYIRQVCMENWRWLVIYLLFLTIKGLKQGHYDFFFKNNKL